MNHVSPFLDIVRSIARPMCVFLQGDPGMSSLWSDVRNGKRELFRLGKISQEELENQFGVFIRFRIEETIYSGLIPASSRPDATEIAISLQTKLDEKNAKLLTLLQLPDPPIPKFPFFTTCDMVLNATYGVKDQLAQNYWRGYSNDTDAISGWLKDFIRFRREIIFTVAPQLETEVPYVLSKQTVLGLHNPQSKTAALRYYRNTGNRDVVDVREAQGVIGILHSERGSSTDEDIYSRNFTLPPPTELLQEITYFTRIQPKIYYDWGHPYFAAAADLKKHIERHNRLTTQTYQDATCLTEAKLQNWTYTDLKTKRELMKRFPELNELFGDFAEPVHAINIYRLNKPAPSFIRDGTIDTYYFRSTEDQIDTLHVEGEETAQTILENVFAVTTKDALHWESSTISYYLKDKLGRE